MVAAGTADLVNLDGGHILQAGLNYNLQPFAAEYYGAENSGGELQFNRTDEIILTEHTMGNATTPQNSGSIIIVNFGR